MQKLFVGKKFLFAPLDWGLGHATRSAPIIQKLLAEGAEVILAGDGSSLEFLKEIFTDLSVYALPSYNIEYPKGRGGAWRTVFKAAQIIQTIKNEQKIVEQLVEDLKIDAVLSDNRYGVYSLKVPSVFIGHQLRVLPPVGFRWGSGLILAWHKKYLKHFSEIWVPDAADENGLSGILSHGVDAGVPIKFIGPQSRFSLFNKIASHNHSKIVAVLSGPEPQRSLLEEVLMTQLKEIGEPAILIRGVVKEAAAYIDENVEVINYLHAEELFQVLQSAKLIICRPGYSTLMDLSYIKKKVILVPTPGQTEQEYLGRNLAQNKLAVYQNQSKVNLRSAIQSLGKVNELDLSQYSSDTSESYLQHLAELMS